MIHWMVVVTIEVVRMSIRIPIIFLSFRSSSFGDDRSLGGGDDNESGAGASANVNGVSSAIGSFLLFKSVDDNASSGCFIFSGQQILYQFITVHVRTNW